MQIEMCKTKSKCDFFGCNNLAKYSFSTKGIFKHELCFCEQCLTQMYECIAKLTVPKGTKSPFKLNKRLGEQHENKQ